MLFLTVPRLRAHTPKVPVELLRLVPNGLGSGGKTRGCGREGETIGRDYETTIGTLAHRIVVVAD